MSSSSYIRTLKFIWCFEISSSGTDGAYLAVEIKTKAEIGRTYYLYYILTMMWVSLVFVSYRMSETEVKKLECPFSTEDQKS